MTAAGVILEGISDARRMYSHTRTEHDYIPKRQPFLLLSLFLQCLGQMISCSMQINSFSYGDTHMTTTMPCKMYSYMNTYYGRWQHNLWVSIISLPHDANGFFIVTDWDTRWLLRNSSLNRHWFCLYCRVVSHPINKHVFCLNGGPLKLPSREISPTILNSVNIAHVTSNAVAKSTLCSLNVQHDDRSDNLTTAR